MWTVVSMNLHYKYPTKHIGPVPALEASMLTITALINTKICVYIPLINTSTEVYRIQNNLLYSIVIL
jgi:hypothetical protein